MKPLGILKMDAYKVNRVLKKEYPDDELISLNWDTPLQLLIATMLSAQCTDDRVNMVTPDLFSRYKNVQEFAEADYDELNDIIWSVNFHNNKAKNIISSCKQILERFGGEVPSTIEELVTLPGVGRKTANVVVGDAFNKPSVVCDTHCIRVTNRLGWTTTDDPKMCEMELRKILMPAYATAFCHRMFWFGRERCTAFHPKCEGCCIAEFCATAGQHDGSD